ncbi:SAM-dependent methyltransferase [Paenibacillus sp. BJ-4]|uniref:SAM-dependent methyltransferase n=1 Tax=Paenibacillus sp. BJ-4 TaxID=2878097 RepID=UPI001CF01FC0|nr:methyltransferase domain-containing protein [Paenibacillus sp. BJ-4]
MGPSSIIMIEELTRNLHLQKGMRMLDLGCRTGLTSIYLAQKFGVTVFAVDLWINGTENYRRFREFGLENQIISIHADACSLPFAEQYLDCHLTPLVKKGGILAVAMPGVKTEFNGAIPVDLQPFLSLSEDDIHWHTCDWWRELWQQSPNVCVESVREMNGFSKAWDEWLQCDNDYARDNIALLDADNGKYMNLISLIATKK